MGWLDGLGLDGLGDARTDWDRVGSLSPVAFDALGGFLLAAWEDTEPLLLELARLRIAALLGNPGELARRSGSAREAGLTEAKLGELSTWTTSAAFTPLERACLSLTEQFVADAKGVTQAQVEAITDHLGAQGCYAFVAAVSVVERFQRACLTLGVQTGCGVDQLMEKCHQHSPQDPG